MKKELRIIRYALSSIARNPMRTFLTMLGIVIGIASVIALMEIGNGVQKLTAERIASMGVNSITIRPGAAFSGGISSGSGNKVTITVRDAEEILKNCEHVQAITPVVGVRGQLIYGGKNWNPFSINGVNEEFLTIGSWEMGDGEFFSRRDVVRGAKVCVIGTTVQRELFGEEDPIGKDLRIQNVNFKIVGILKSKGANSMGFDQDDVVLAPWTAVKARLKGAGSSSATASSSNSTTSVSGSSIYTDGVSFYPPENSTRQMPPVRFQNVDRLNAWATSPEDVQLAVKEIAISLRASHKLSDDEDDDFNIRTMSEFANFLESQTKNMTNLLLCVAFVLLLVGGVGIMNIMLVSVTERTREIGLRMAVGARSKDILRQFLLEAVVLCLAGGITGIFFGHGLSMLLSGLMGWPSEVSYAAIILSVGVSALVGILFGFYPAWKASRLDPIDALRYE